ncbi:MAG: hypothetical protein AAF982_01975 [Pseudomonadota bacterium]
MPVIFEPGYTLPGADRPLTHSRIAHAGNWISGTVTVSSTDANPIYSAGAPANSLLSEKWKPASVPANWSLEAAAATEVDYCVISGHDLHVSGGEAVIQYFDGAIWVTLATASGLTTGDTILAIFAPVTATQFRVLNNGFASSFGFIRFGKALQMEERSRYAGRVPFKLARQVTTTGNQSVRGEPLAKSILRAGRPVSFTWSYLSESFTTNDVSDLLDAIETDVFVIADRPGTHADDVALFWLSGPRPMPRANGAMDLHDLELTAEGYLPHA